MSKRWTMEELEKADNLEFAACILNERRAFLNAYSPLSVKLAQAVDTIEHIKAELDRYNARLELERDMFLEAITGKRSTRNMTEEEYEAYCADMAGDVIEELLAKINQPDRSPLAQALIKALYNVNAIKEETEAECQEDREE